MATGTQIDPNELAAEWVTRAMEEAELSVGDLSRKSGVTKVAINNLIKHRIKNACRFDTLVLLVYSCGLTFRDFENTFKPLQNYRKV
jgi:hypothetical protein